MASRVMSVSAFWRNDRPGGIGFTIQFEGRDPHAGSHYQEAVERSLLTWDKHANAADLLAQLADFATVGGASFTRQEQFVTIVNVAWLESRGHLASDDFNGILWLTEVN